MVQPGRQGNHLEVATGLEIKQGGQPLGMDLNPIGGRQVGLLAKAREWGVKIIA